MPIEGFGSGNFTLDWDAPQHAAAHPASPLNNKPDVGKASYSYARLSATADVSVDAQFRQVRDNDHPDQRGRMPTTSTARPRAPAAAWSSCTPPPRT
jgi:hypothetical protein